MDPRSVSRSWRLESRVAAETQGIVATGFGHLQTGRALLLCFNWKPPYHGNGAWLAALRQIAPISDAVLRSTKPSRSAALAISWSGLALMGLSETALNSFSRPFREGMFDEDRLRRLGDRRGKEWEKTVVPGGPVWSANTELPPPVDSLPIGFRVPDPATDNPPEKTQHSVHAILLLYGNTCKEVADWTKQVADAIAPHGVSIVRERELELDVTGQEKFAREHFGFADGLSQPLPFDQYGGVLMGDKPVKEPHPQHGVPLGEFLFGHINGHGEISPGPVVPDNTGGFVQNVPDPRLAKLQPRQDAQGFFDLGRNGSYLVVRELNQDVAAFWNSMEANAARLRAQDPAHLGSIDAKWIAERVVGRDINGNMLCPADKGSDGKPIYPGGVLPTCPDGAPDNDFEFWHRDRYGRGCPLGSHVRRANPRDGLSPDEGQRDGLRHSANNHRILRRGRSFGPVLADRLKDDGEDRGLLFMCLNTDIARQFEFIQQTWLLNSSFSTLYKEVDPLVGPDGPMTVHLDDDPLRLIPKVETYVRFVGGDYFFLPSLPALTYLEAL
jgi:deferrochelatase/peroxidase EfeB